MSARAFGSRHALPLAATISEVSPKEHSSVGAGRPPQSRGGRMLAAFLSLVGCQLVGELIRQALHLPLPGPVIGMFLLATVLGLRGRRTNKAAIPQSLDTMAETLIAYMGLLFVPAGVGIVAQLGLLRQEWLPILVGVLGSTILSVAVTGLVMHLATLSVEKRPRATSRIANQQLIRP
jgi:holin-like protein